MSRRPSTNTSTSFSSNICSKSKQLKSNKKQINELKKFGKHCGQQYRVLAFGFMLLLTFLSYGYINIKRSTYYTIYYNIPMENSSSSTQSTNISQNKIINPKCDSPTLIGVQDTILVYVRVRYGFSIPCNRPNNKNFPIMVSCSKYNNSVHSITKTEKELFCDGGKLIHSNMRWLKTFVDIQSKPSLHRVLDTYCNKYHMNDNVCDFTLLSYSLDIPAERNEFLNTHIDCNNNTAQYDKTWVFKENVDMGSGIHVYNNHKLIYDLIIANISENINNCTFKPIQNLTYFKEEEFVNYHKIANGTGYVIDRNGLIIQEFVANPLLVKVYPEEKIRHVFHLRSFFMIVSYSNPFIVLHYPKPIILINPNKYENKQKLNKKVIITNAHSNPETMNSTVEYTWGRGKLQSFLDMEYGKQLFDGNYTTNKLNNDIKHILKHLFAANSYNNKLKKARAFEYINNYHFDILCMDIIITDQFELKLMEINSHCGDGCSKPERLETHRASGTYDWDCEGRYTEGSRIIMEIFKKKYYNEPIQKLNSLNQWEIAFWE